MGIAGIAISILAWRFFEIPIYYGILAVLLTFVLALVAARATGETDITPGGPLGKIMQLTYGVLIPQSTTANLMTASITSNSSLACADLLNDLKSGYLLGAHPRRQFVAQFMGVFTGTVASTLGYFILVPNAGVFNSVNGADPKFAAPGAQQWKAVAELFKVGIHNLHPMARECIVIGIVIGAIFTLVEFYLPKAKKYLPSATGIGLGLLLPFSSAAFVFDRRAHRRGARPNEAEDRGAFRDSRSPPESSPARASLASSSPASTTSSSTDRHAQHRLTR